MLSSLLIPRIYFNEKSYDSFDSNLPDQSQLHVIACDKSHV